MVSSSRRAPILETRHHRFGDKGAQESAQPELSMIKTTEVIGDDQSLDHMEALQIAQTGRGRRFAQVRKNDNFSEGKRFFRNKKVVYKCASERGRPIVST